MAFAGGTGTALDPYLISNAAQLNDARNFLSSYFKQTANINLKTYANWVPIGNYSARFTGGYDGNNFNIYNLSIYNVATDESGDYIGLFGYTNQATLKNINIINANITGYRNVGALVGYLWYSSVDNCKSSGSVSGYSSVGGLIGAYITYSATDYYNILNSSSSCIVTGTYQDVGGFAGILQTNGFGYVEKCFATGKVFAQYESGGFAGNTNIRAGYATTHIKDCYATGDVTQTGDDNGDGGYIGGFAAYATGNTINCYSTGLVTLYAGATGYGGFLSAVGGSAVITSCYYDSETSGQSDNDGRGIPKTTEEMKAQSTFVDWDFTTPIWNIVEGCLYPEFSQYIEIWTAEDLNNVRNSLNANYIQMADIDLSGYTNWIPIGNTTTPFKGTYDGQDFNISTLTINTSGQEVGLFGSINTTGFIKNIHLIDVNISCDGYTGALAQNINGGTFINCSSSGTISTVLGHAAGLLYYIYPSNPILIDNCSSSIDITATSIEDGVSLCGGVLGPVSNYYSISNIEIKNCYGTGNIITPDWSPDYESNYTAVCGGLAANINGSDGKIINVSNCYATGNIICNTSVGGLIGSITYVKLSNSYSLGNVSIGQGWTAVNETESIYSLGGLIGDATGNSEIDNCYSTGLVTVTPYGGEPTDIGGLIGWNNDNILVSSYYNSETSGQSDTGKGVPKTTAELKLQETYVDWDFTTPIWYIDDGYSYPVLSPCIEIWTAEDLDNVRNGLNANYIQMANIDLSGYTNWIPIGDDTSQFKGSYNGGNFNITNLTVDDEEGVLSTEGLFGSISGASLKNICIQGHIGSYEYIGMLAGLATNSSIINCQSAGTILIYNWNQSGRSGGLVGQATDCNFTDCNSSVDITSCITDAVSGLMSMVGGLIGGMYSDANHCDILNCYATGDIICPDFSYFEGLKYSAYIGGFIGDCSGNISITKCYSTGNIIGMQILGGFIANCLGESANPINILNCYATGNVSFTDVIDLLPDIYEVYSCGGFIGITADCVLTNCYYSGILQNTAPTNASLVDIKGFIGIVDNATANGVYYDNTKTSIVDNIATPKTTAEMKLRATYVDWDFTDIWAIVQLTNDGYPSYKGTSVNPLDSHPEGSTMVTLEDGTIVITEPDGTIYDIVTSGIITIKYTNGDTIVIGLDDSRTLYGLNSGGVIYIMKDGNALRLL